MLIDTEEFVHDFLRLRLSVLASIVNATIHKIFVDWRIRDDRVCVHLYSLTVVLFLPVLFLAFLHAITLWASHDRCPVATN